MQADRTRRGVIWTLFILLAAMAVAVPWRAQAQQATPSPGADGLPQGVTWLLEQQLENGGFAGLSGEADAGVTADAVIALVAARNAGVAVDAAALDRAVAFLEENALVYAQTGPGQAAKLVLAAVAVGRNPRDFATVNPLSIIEASARRGQIGFSIYDHALGLLALRAAGAAVPPNALQPLQPTQLEDGSWSFDGSTNEGAGDTNTTAIVLQALAALGLGDDPMAEKAIDYLRSAQAEDGGFPYQPGGAPDSNSTALAVQAIIAMGENPASEDWRNAAAALARFQNQSGAFRYQDEMPDDNLLSTLQALPALAGQAFPVMAGGSASDGTSTIVGTPVGGP